MEQKDRSKLKYQSKEIQFLGYLIKAENLTHTKNPLFSILLGQMSKLLVVLDSAVEYQQKVGKILNRIKEEWNGSDPESE